MMTVYDVFLSHVSEDKPTVEALAGRLAKTALSPFSTSGTSSPASEPWQEGLEDAFGVSRTCAVFVGAELGTWQNEEVRSALDDRIRNSDFRVIPVLLPGVLMPGSRDLPRFLQAATRAGNSGDAARVLPQLCAEKTAMNVVLMARQQLAP